MGFIHSNIILFVFFHFSINIHGENLLCPVFPCGNNTLNTCSYFSLSCSLTQSQLVVSLPHSGKFYVQNIDYTERYIQLNDPENCLMRRLMNFSLDSSPFKANYNANYTFYVCPVGSYVFESDVNEIGCLSNSTNITVATHAETLRDSYSVEIHGCMNVGSWLLPVSEPMQYDDDGLYDDRFLFLTWDQNVCNECDNQDSGKSPAKPIAAVIALALSMPALIVLSLSCCTVFCFHLLKMIADKQEGYPVVAMAPPPLTTVVELPSTTGLDKSKIMACTKVVVLNESDDSNSNTCSICLENYCKKETVRIISNCGHCFHDSCIQQWLEKNSTCPVCRTCLSDVAL